MSTLGFSRILEYRDRTVNTALVLVAITRRRAVVDCHAVLYFVTRRHARKGNLSFT